MQSSFISALQQTCKRHGDKIAIIDREGRRKTTYGGLLLLGFYWNTTTSDYVLRFLKAINSLGLFDENYSRF